MLLGGQKFPNPPSHPRQPEWGGGRRNGGGKGRLERRKNPLIKACVVEPMESKSVVVMVQ